MTTIVEVNPASASVERIDGHGSFVAVALDGRTIYLTTSEAERLALQISRAAEVVRARRLRSWCLKTHGPRCRRCG